MRNDIPLSVYVYVPKLLCKNIYTISEKLSKKVESKFSYTKNIYRPHFTLSFGLFPQKNVERVTDIIRSITFSPFRIFADNVSIDKGGFFKYVPSQGYENVCALHEEILEKLNPLREGVLREKYQNLDDEEYTQRDRELIQKYGRRWVREQYEPHITIMKIEKKNIPRARKLIKNLRVPKLEFIANEIALIKQKYDRYPESDDEFQRLL